MDSSFLWGRVHWQSWGRKCSKYQFSNFVKVKNWNDHIQYSYTTWSIAKVSLEHCIPQGCVFYVYKFTFNTKNNSKQTEPIGRGYRVLWTSVSVPMLYCELYSLYPYICQFFPILISILTQLLYNMSRMIYNTKYLTRGIFGSIPRKS